VKLYDHISFSFAGALFLLLVAGCSNLRYLENGTSLYTGSSIDVETAEKRTVEREVKRELEKVLRPQPNQKVLIWRPRLWLYNIAGEPTGKGVRHIMRNRIGRPPVLFEDVSVTRNVRLMENRLHNMGFFDSRLSWSIETKPKRTSVHYNVNLRAPYVFGELHEISDPCPVGYHINSSLEETLVETGSRYSLETLKRERQRIDRLLKDKGYFYFHPDYIIFRADSTAGDRVVDISTNLKDDIPERARKSYTIGNVFVYADYLTGHESTIGRTDTIDAGESLFLFDALGSVNPETIRKSVLFRKDSLYSQQNHRNTLNRLFNLGVFKFVNIRFTETSKEGEDFLDVSVLLTPADRKSLSAELKGVSKSNNFAGPGISAGFTNRNLAGGAENFRFGFNLAYESLISRQANPASAWNAGLETELSSPDLLLPSRLYNRENINRPRTSITLGFEYMTRTDVFDLSSGRFRYSYSWNRGNARQHLFSPLVFNVYAVGRISGDFENVFLESDLLRRGLFEQFIIGSRYSYVYNTQLESGSQHNLFFAVNLDFSGNTTYAAMKYLGGDEPESNGYYTIFGQGFSQYSRAEIDLRYYLRLSEERRIATRFFAGGGFPYGNSTHLPYVKTFSTGGSNSLRAFHPRTIGPGAYQPVDDAEPGQEIYRTGEIKLEANVEYRFRLTGIFRGAIFLDAGNIWKLREEEHTPGGIFRYQNFYEQIAVGAGTGIRVDASFFLLRFDFAFPVMLPYSSGFPGPFRPFDREWRRNNIIFNLGIGYPF